jgi:hypothetical protein
VAPVDHYREEKEQWKVRHVRILAICVVAACAISALAVANASAALPEWGKCVKTPVTIKGKEHKTGKYSNSNCTEAQTGGEYEFVKGTEGLPTRTFTNTMTSSEATLSTSFGVEVKCSGESATGELSGTKEVSNVIVRFIGCKANLLSLACEDEIRAFEREGKIEWEYLEGEITTHTLKGKLGYISGKGTANPAVGLELEPEQKHGLFAFFGCGSSEPATPVIFSNVGENTTIKDNGGDSIISPITPINKMGTETTQVYAGKTVENPETKEIEKVRGVQEPSAFENGKPDFLETQLLSVGGPPSESEWGKAAQEETAVTKLTSGEELEIKA